MGRDINKYNREYYAKNPERYKKVRAEYYQQNKDKYAASSYKWYSDPDNKIKLRERKFNIDFWAMVEEQENRCAICGVEFVDYSQVHIDHDHQSGFVRGLLCKQHNRGLGFFGDDWELLEKASQYVRKAKERFDEQA